MISGAHTILYSKDANADRAFFRDVLDMPNVDVGGGWLIFALPPSEIAFHPAEKSGASEFYLMCDGIDAFIASMKEKNVACAPVEKMSWGALTRITLPGGGALAVYEPRHARPPSV